MAMGDDEKAWFAPKRYGYGSGLPIAWQGWAVLTIYVLIMGAAGLLLQETTIGFIAVTIVATAILCVVCARKTRGGWRWRWSE